MKLKSRLPVLILTLCLTFLFTCALAEPPMDIVISEVTVESDFEVPSLPELAPESMPEASDTPTEGFPETTETPAETPENTADVLESVQYILPELTLPPDEMPQTEGSTFSLGSDFNRGYVKLNSATTGYSSASPNAEAVVYLEKSMLYATERRTTSANDRIRIHFDGGGETRSVWIDAYRLQPLSDSEIQAFVASRSGRSGVRYYGGNLNLPLDTPNYSSVVTYSLVTQEPRAAVPAMFVEQTKLSLFVGETLPIGISFSDSKGYLVTFISEDDAIATVSGDGRVTGIVAGTTRIRLKSEHGNEAIVEIQVQ